ncbi:MAG: SHOCT domain-containing protein [Acidimicrobiales bacterium]
MVFAEVGLSDLIWTTIWVFFLVMFIWVFITVVGDLFRDHTLSGWAKAIWVVALVAFPFLGSLVYLIARGQGMAERHAERERVARSELDSYIRSTAAATGTAPVDDLTRLAELRSRGVISDPEFETMKSRVVGGMSPAS